VKPETGLTPVLVGCILTPILVGGGSPWCTPWSRKRVTRWRPCLRCGCGEASVHRRGRLWGPPLLRFPTSGGSIGTGWGDKDFHP
jgi:hypothetical protein